MRLSLRLLFVLAIAVVPAAPTAVAQVAPDIVRVRILDRQAPSRVTVDSDAPIYLVVDGADAGASLGGTPVILTASRGDARAEFGGADLSGREVRLEADRLRVRAGGVDRVYAGAIVAHVEGGRLRIVNHSPMEPYVASVVTSEFGFPVLEGAKAQAILARTYAARRTGKHTHYDLDDHTGSQVFKGIDEANDTSRRAAHETAGEVLTYRGTLADAYYFSSSGGHTADNDLVWNGQPLPYLRGVPDPYDSVAPDHQWTTSADRGAVLRAMSQQAGGSVSGIRVERRSRSGRVLTVGLDGGRQSTMTGAQFRRAVNAVAGGRTVRSTQFEISAEDDRYVFRGGGYGHGVGLSQYGALAQAREGRGYREILAHYFQGTDVSGSGGFVAPVMVAGATAAPPRSRPTPRHEAAAVVETPATPGAPSEAIPREPSALRTRYQPASGRRWPTPRREAREAAAEPPVVVAERPTPTPRTTRATPAPAPEPVASAQRRTAW